MQAHSLLIMWKLNLPAHAMYVRDLFLLDDRGLLKEGANPCWYNRSNILDASTSTGHLNIAVLPEQGKLSGSNVGINALATISGCESLTETLYSTPVDTQKRTCSNLLNGPNQPNSAPSSSKTTSTIPPSLPGRQPSSNIRGRKNR